MISGHPFDDDKLREECGVFGVFGREDAGALTILGLHALQHRGEEGVGVASYNGTFHHARHVGLVGDAFDETQPKPNLPGRSAIGHVRYSTTGGSLAANVQPMYADLAGGGVALAHNGNLTNARSLKRDLVTRGAIFQSTSDTEVILHLMATSRLRGTADRIIDALRQVEGAFSLVALTTKKLIGVRDPLGVRPLVLGRIGDGWVFSSETCGLDIIGATFVRDVEPGEMVIINDQGLMSLRPFNAVPPRFCIFEYVYFARPDSMVEGRNVYEVRKQIGRELAREHAVAADMVIPIPDSGVPAAIGYASGSGIDFELGIIRNHYVGRTFIQPTQEIRDIGVKLKHNTNRAQIAGKRVVLVDDSIVRGTTSRKIIQMVRDAGATEVHMRIASPPTMNPCFYGVDTPRRENLMAANMMVEAMRQKINADSLGFISIDGLYRAVGEAKRDTELPQFCDACFTGDYPTILTDELNDQKSEQLPLLSVEDSSDDLPNAAA
ncbi:MAG: amidophosphoribosyltransferase [Alphaproteobacteria bacterium]|nr:amidophosphoribosyltransferase [Alphaproteobacteria bacterium]